MATKPENINPFAQFVEQPKQEPNPFEQFVKPQEPTALSPEEQMMSSVGADSSAGWEMADYGKLIGSAALRGTMAAPEATQAAASGMARDTVTKPTEILNYFADPRKLANDLAQAVRLPKIFEEDAKAGIVPEKTVEKQRIAVDEALTKGKLESLRSLTEYGNKISDQIEDSVTPEMKLALAESQPTGNIIEAFQTGDFSKISLGKNPSLLGLTGQGAKVFGSAAPGILTSIITKSATPGAVFGFGQAASEGVDTAREHIKNMSDEQLAKDSEYFRNLLVMGYTPEMARKMTEDKAGDTAAYYQGVVGALGGAFTGNLVTGKLDDVLLASAKTRLGRILKGTTAGMAEEGFQELAEGVATDLGINKTVVREMGVDSFANLVLGAIGGGAPGGIRGAVSKAPEKPGEVTPSVVPPSVAGAPTKIAETELEGEVPPPAPPAPPAAPAAEAKPTDTAEVRPNVTPVTSENQPTTMTLFRGVQAGKEGQPTVGGALFMTPDKSVAKMYAGESGKVTESQVTFNNLLASQNWLEAKQKVGLPQEATMEDLVNKARDLGYDGVTFNTTNGQEVISIPEVKLAKNEMLMPIIDENGNTTDQKEKINLDKVYLEDGQVWVEGTQYDHDLQNVLEELTDEVKKANLIKKAEALQPKATEVLKEEEVKATPAVAEKSEAQKNLDEFLSQDKDETIKQIAEGNGVDLDYATKAYEAEKEFREAKAKYYTPELINSPEFKDAQKKHTVFFNKLRQASKKAKAEQKAAPVVAEDDYARKIIDVRGGLKTKDLIKKHGQAFLDQAEKDGDIRSYTVGKEKSYTTTEQGEDKFYNSIKTNDGKYTLKQIHDAYEDALETHGQANILSTYEFIKEYPAEMLQSAYDSGFVSINDAGSIWPSYDANDIEKRKSYAEKVDIAALSKEHESVDKVIQAQFRKEQEEKLAKELKKAQKKPALTKEEKAAENRKRQEEKKAAAEKAKQPVDTSEVKDLISGKIKKILGWTIYKRAEDPDLWYVQSPENHAENKIGRGDEVSTNIDTARSKIEQYIADEEYAKAKAAEAPKAKEAPSVRKEEAPKAEEKHIEGKKSEPVTAKTIEEAIDKAETKVDYKEIKQAVKNQFDLAIKRAKIKTEEEWSSAKGLLPAEQFVTIDIPGDGKFKVKNNVERLKQLQTKITNAVEPKAPKKPTGVTSGAMEAFKAMVDEKDMENAIEYAKLKDIDIKEAKLNPTQRSIVDKYLKNPAEFERQKVQDESLEEAQQEALRRDQEKRMRERLEAEEKREEEARFKAVIDTTIRSTEAQLKRDIAAKKISLADARKMLEAFPNYPTGVVKPYTIRLIEKRAGAEPSFKKLRKTTTEDGFNIQNPIMTGLVDVGYEMLDLRNPRTYVDKNGTPFRTFEKNGVRVALEPSKVLFKQKGKEYGRVGTAIGNENDITVEHLIVDPEFRKQGLAKKVLQDLTYLADKHKINMYLEPAQLEEAGMTKDQLSKLYSKFQWKQTNESGSPMKRVPESYEEKMDRIDAELKAEGRVHEMTRAAKELAEVKAKIAELQAQAPTETILTPPQQKILEKEVDKLSDDEIATLEQHYGVDNYSLTFLKRVREDAVKYINDGANAVDKAVRSIISKLAAAILSVAIVFNPNFMSDASAVVLPQVVTKTVQAEVPTAAKGMSESGQKAYATLYPALKQELQKNNKYFTVVDKPTSQVYVFNPDGSLMTQSTVVLGNAFGDTYVGKTDFKENRITPAGLFKPKAEKGSATYDGKTVYTLGNVKEGWNAVFMHTVYLKAGDAEARLKALETGKGTRLSYGCINGPTDLMQKIDNKSMDESHIFIVPDNQAATDDYIANRVSNEDLTRETVTPVTEKVPAPKTTEKGQQELLAREEEAERPPKSQAEINRERQQAKRQAMLKAESPYYGSFTNNIDEKTIGKMREEIKKEASDSSRYVKNSLTQLLRIIAKGQVGIRTQKEITELLQARTELNKEKKFARIKIDSADWFLKNAIEDAEMHRVYPNDPSYGVTPEVLAVIKDIHAKYPKLLEGLRLSVKTRKEGGAAGNFDPLSRLVTLFKDTSGVEDPKTFRHEIMHSIEQMMPADVYQAVVDNWAKSLGKAMEKFTDKPHQKYFEKVLDFVNNPTNENYEAAVAVMPSYDMYQYINPSEFWAVNAEKLFAARLGGRWENFKRAISKIFESLKSVFGFDNKYGVHKAFDSLFKGPLDRGTNRTMLVDYLRRNNDKDAFTFLNNFEEYDNRREEDGRSEAIIKTSPSLLDRMLGGFKGAKRTWKHVIANPTIPTSNMGGKLSRALTWVRVKNVWYAKGLEVAEFKKYGGQLRDGMNKAIASVSVTNALHAGHIGSEVILRGKLIFNEATQMFQAVRDKFSMANVMIAKHDLIERVGTQRANNMIQDYFEAKRSRSIIDEYLQREGEFAALEAAYEAAVTDEDKSKIRKELVEAEKGLKAIDIARKKVNMDDEQIDFYSSLEDENPELRTMMDNWTAVNHNMIDNMEMSNLISAKRAKQLRSIKDYVPWYRIKDNMEEVHSPAGAVRSLTNVAQEKKFGDYETDLDIDDIVDNMLHNVMVLTRNSIRNHAANQVAMAYATRHKEGKNKGKIIRFAEEGVGPNGEVRTNVVINGKRVIIEIQDPLIAQSVLGMESVAIPGLEIFGMIANNLRRGVTLWPEFQLKQLFMDAPTAALVSGVKNPHAVYAETFRSFIKALNSNDPIVDNLKSYGIGGYQSVHRAPEQKYKQQIGLLEKNKIDWLTDKLDRVSDASDYAQRIAIYKRVMKETNGDELQAIMQANNVIDFMKHGSGSVAQFLSRTVSFMNAYAQQIDVLVETLAGGGLKGRSRGAALAQLAKTGAMLGFYTMMYCWAVGDDDEYQKLDDQTKLRNFFISKKITGLKEDLLIPMHTSASFFFKSMPELAYNYIITKGTKNEHDAARVRRALGKAAIDALLGPNPIPTGVKPFVEIGLNHNFLTGGTVTPKGLENLESAEQYNAATSELGKIISAASFGALNPIQADHLVRGLFGTTGSMVMYGSNMFNGERATPQAKDNPLYGGLVAADVARGPEDLFYDLRDRAEEKDATFKKLHERGRHEEADKYLEKNRLLIEAAGYTTDVGQTLKEINKEIRRLGESAETGMTADQRRERIKDMQLEKARILEDISRYRREYGL